VIILFWLWLGIDIVFSQVVYLSTVNFWWVGVFPLVFLVYTFSNDKNIFWRYAFTFLILVVVILCIFALLQLFVLHDQPRATFYNKNSLAALINLLLFPLLAIMLLCKSNKQLILYFAVAFIFILLLGVINSRGALLSFSIGLVIMLAFPAVWHNTRRVFLTGLLISAAFLVASLLMQNAPQTSGTDIVDRIISLQNTDAAGKSRFVIWRPAWDLFLQSPWTGIGLGTYFLAIPQTLHINDHSAGFYVHNDYLQIALETGIPGFILFLLILLATTSRFISSLRVSQNDQPQVLHFLALFAALLTLAIHSVFTYNLYIMPIMLIAGLLLGRFNQLADHLESVQKYTWQPAHLFRPAVYYTVLGLVIVTSSSYFIRIGAAYHYQHKAYQLAAINQLENAHNAFRHSQNLAPRVDSSYYADADLLRKSALLLANRPELAQGLLEEAEVLLDRAEELNSLRPHTPYIRGMVLEQKSPDKQNQIIEAYQAALIRNPRFLPARIAAARYLIEQDKQDHAIQLLQDGLAYSYRQISPAYLQLLEMNSAVAISTGNIELANHLSGLLENSRQDYAAILSAQRRNKIINPY
jgi:O-antigen ligase